jgi:hypothetical protein
MEQTSILDGLDHCGREDLGRSGKGIVAWLQCMLAAPGIRRKRPTRSVIPAAGAVAEGRARGIEIVGRSVFPLPAAPNEGMPASAIQTACRAIAGASP